MFQLLLTKIKTGDRDFKGEGGGGGGLWKRADCSHTVAEAVSSSPNRPTFNIFCALSKQREFQAVSLANVLILMQSALTSWRNSSS